MILKLAYRDSDDNHLKEYWDELRRKNYDSSFEGVKSFIKKNEALSRRRRKPLRKWQWVMVALIPVLVLLACTKTESVKPVGYSVSFMLPKNAKQSFDALQKFKTTSLLKDESPARFISYTTFVPAANATAEDLKKELQKIKGLQQLQILPVTTTVKESFISRLSYKIFKSHIDATELTDDALKQTIESQLHEKGIDVVVDISSVNGKRRIQILPAKVTTDYLIDLSITDGFNKTVLQEEIKSGGKSPPGISTMSDADLRDYIRKEHGAHIKNEEIEIKRTAEDVVVTIKQGDELETTLRYKLKK